MNVDKLYSCCFTGHRKIKSADMFYLSEELNNVVGRLISNGVNIFITGGAIGFDTLTAGVIIGYKRKGFPIKLHLALPCKNQSELWNDEDKQRYDFIKSYADKEIYIEENYSKTCMKKRNDYMVENSSFCVAYMRREKTGTSYTLNKARKDGLSLIEL